MNQKQDKTMRLVVASPDLEILNAVNVDWVNTILSDGYPVSIYANHTPMVVLTSACNLKYRIDGKVHEKAIPAGILSVKDNLVRIWTDFEVMEKSENGEET